jgi:hypothetical protein
VFELFINIFVMRMKSKTLENRAIMFVKIFVFYLSPPILKTKQKKK